LSIPRVHADDPGMDMGASQDHRLKHSREHDVVGEVPPARDVTGAFFAAHMGADVFHSKNSYQQSAFSKNNSDYFLP
jgi:hypothetical protein